MHLVSTLRRLASGGRAVVTTIHQPSSRLYMQLDKLLLLSEGHVMYYGEPLLPFNHSISHPGYFPELQRNEVKIIKSRCKASLFSLSLTPGILHDFNWERL